ncbi:MAG: hypothetical protein PHX30_03705 [Candidatus Pacebacteria bacterium]|nr:hypothetical protein [Candidatus Paceibacterota bacterium]
MEIFYLEKKMRDTTSLSSIAGVYWSSRDMEGFFIGNHHFITFIYESEAQAKRIAEKWGIEYFSEVNDKSMTVYYSTMGAGKGDGTNYIRINFSPGADRQSIHEIAKEDNTSYFSSDYDYQGHRAPYDLASPAFSSYEELMDAILESVSNFNAHFDAGDRVKYSLIDENCACIVNSIFKVLGYSSSDRQEMGEFWGVDWGEEDLISDRYLKAISLVGNSSTLELHIEGCEWEKLINEEHRVHFDTVEEAITQGYNGCHYCLNAYDTD